MNTLLPRMLDQLHNSPLALTIRAASESNVSSANPPAIAYPIMALLRNHTAESIEQHRTLEYPFPPPQDTIGVLSSGGPAKEVERDASQKGAEWVACTKVRINHTSHILPLIRNGSKSRMAMLTSLSAFSASFH